jgi:hypothetical protein
MVEPCDRLPGAAANDPGQERQLAARQQLALVEQSSQGFRAGRSPYSARTASRAKTQREIAVSMGLSQSTVESDLRMVYRLLDDLRRKLDEE